MSKSNCRIYCAVYGCFNSTLTHPDITFFKLPGNSDRRVQWLKLIGRDDLVKKPNFAAYRICEKHFDEDDIRQSSNRKLLKKNALPSLMLPSLESIAPKTEDKQTQTDLTITVDKCTQTSKSNRKKAAKKTKRKSTKDRTSKTCTQTSKDLSSNNRKKSSLLYALLRGNNITIKKVKKT